MLLTDGLEGTVCRRHVKCSLEQLMGIGLLITPSDVADVGHPSCVQSDFSVGDIRGYEKKRDP